MTMIQARFVIYVIGFNS